MKTTRVIAAVAPGIYKLDDGSFRVVTHAGNSRVNQRRKEKRFPSSAGIREMKRWQANVRATFQRDGIRLQRDTVAADIPRFMRVMRQRLTCPDHRDNEIRAWLARFADRRRHAIDTEELRQQVIAWEGEGLAASTINHRLSALSQLYGVLDGESSHNPVSVVKRLREPQAKPARPWSTSGKAADGSPRRCSGSESGGSLRREAVEISFVEGEFPGNAPAVQYAAGARAHLPDQSHSDERHNRTADK